MYVKKGVGFLCKCVCWGLLVDDDRPTSIETLPSLPLLVRQSSAEGHLGRDQSEPVDGHRWRLSGHAKGYGMIGDGKFMEKRSGCLGTWNCKHMGRGEGRGCMQIAVADLGKRIHPGLLCQLVSSIRATNAMPRFQLRG